MMLEARSQHLHWISNLLVSPGRLMAISAKLKKNKNENKTKDQEHGLCYEMG